MEQTNFIGLVYSTLEEAGIDTSNLTLEEAIAKYNEIAGDNVTVDDVEEQVEEAVQEVAAEETQIEEVVEEEVQENEDDAYIQYVTEHKSEIIALLREKGIEI